MGGYDSLCIVCGIAPSDRALDVYNEPGYDMLDIRKKVAETIAPNLSDLDEEEVGVIIEELLELVECDVWQLEELRGWTGFIRCVAIRHFDSIDGDANLVLDESTKKYCIPTGAGVRTRRAFDHDAGDFSKVTESTVGPNGKRGERVDSVVTHTTAWRENPNFFVSEAFHHYLEAWIDRSALPTQNADVPHTPSLSDFASELYEVVNSRIEVRDTGRGFLPRIDYDGIEDTCEQYQDRFNMRTREGPRPLSAVSEKDFEAELIPHMISDFGCWMFMRPNAWPAPPEDGVMSMPSFTVFGEAAEPQNNALARLPKEVFDTVCGQMSISTFFALSVTCRTFRCRMCDLKVLNHVSREMLQHGPLQWILPVAGVAGEMEAAVTTSETWIDFARYRLGSKPFEPSGGMAGVTVQARSPSVTFYSGDFPAFAFIDACFHSESIRNRRRLYGQVMQFKELWRDYRMEGWEVDRFYHVAK